MIAKWDQFLFGKISPLPLGIYRAIFGALVFTDLLALFPSRQDWWGEQGLLSREGSLLYFGSHHLNVLNLLPNTAASLTFFCVTLMIAALFLMAGLFTRISSVLVFIGLVSLTHRNPMILNSGDTILRVCSFWLMWAPSNKAFSVDRLIKVKFSKNVSLTERPELIEAWSLRLLQIQFCLVYFMTVVWKLKGVTWIRGTAVGRALRIEEFHRFPIPDFIFSPWINHLVTWGTLVVEGSLAILIWNKKLRPWIILAGIGLHLGIEYSMNIPLFEWIMIGSLSLFITEDDVSRIKDRVLDSARLDNFQS